MMQTDYFSLSKILESILGVVGFGVCISGFFKIQINVMKKMLEEDE